MRRTTSLKERTRNKYDFGYEVLGLDRTPGALHAFLEMIEAWRRIRTVESCEPLGLLVGSLARQARPAGGSPLSLMTYMDEAELTAEKRARRHLDDFINELPLAPDYREREDDPACQAFLRGWLTGYTS